MAGTIEYYLSLMSPWTWLGSARLVEIAARHGAEIACRPVQLGQIFPASGGLPLGKRAPQRQAYRLVELARWRDRLGMEINLQPAHFHGREQPAALAVTAAGMQGLDATALAHRVLRGVWVLDEDVSEPRTLARIVAECGHDADALLAAAEADEVAAQYQAHTDLAMERGVFGAPSYVFNGELFWGQDRLDFLDEALQRAAAPGAG